jgi:Cof subfamily protein (haloacid dehalogenase superfamily)
MTGWQPRLVAIDLDGTLLDAEGAVPPANAAALQALPVPYVIVTGRPWRWMAPILEHLPAEGSAILANGALVVDLASGKVLLSRPLAVADALKCARTLRAAVPDCGFAVEYPDLAPYGYEVEYRPRWIPENPRVGPIEELLDRPISKLLCRSPDHDSDSLHAIADKVLAGQPLTLTHSSGGDGLLEISAVGADKGSALAAYAAALGIDRADVIAFGDGRNDLPMLIWAGRGVAVANAHPHTRAAADAVTGAHDANGVAEELARWFAEVAG